MARFSRGNFEDVVDFHKKFFLEYKGPPRALPFDMQCFRVKFLQEELTEYEEAVMKGDMEKAFDALLDLVYVAMGTAHLHGFPWENGWDLVQRANMAKVRVESADESKRGSKFDVKKPVGWVAPDLREVLELQRQQTACTSLELCPHEPA